jgi:hypothetical protein
VRLPFVREIDIQTCETKSESLEDTTFPEEGVKSEAVNTLASVETALIGSYSVVIRSSISKNYQSLANQSRIQRRNHATYHLLYGLEQTLRDLPLEPTANKIFPPSAKNLTRSLGIVDPVKEGARRATLSNSRSSYLV